MARAPKHLLAIYDEVQARARAIAQLAGQWPCGRGCDHCCHHLHRIPEATAAEWELFEQGVRALPLAVRAQLLARLNALPEYGPGKVVCPALDQSSGQCLVYDQRPAACRSYGYYRSRAHDLWCSQIETHLTELPCADQLIWGNQEALESQLQHHYGARITLTEWFRQDHTRP